TEEEARKRGLLARWSDRRHFSLVNFCRNILGGQTRRARAIAFMFSSASTPFMAVVPTSMPMQYFFILPYRSGTARAWPTAPEA
ncbi:MAG TPA: hypothetical protein PKW29_14305, partial [Clostridia bacterium]|nr:hypothetical protein [Clostridia bacterium]